MNLRQRIFMGMAALLSVLVHAVVLYQVMNLPIALTPQSRLFAQTPDEKRLQSVRVYRATEDAIIEDTPTTPTIQTLKPEDEAEKLREQTEKMLADAEKSPALDPKDLAQEKLEGGGDLRVEAPAPKGAMPQPGPARTPDTTKKLLNLAQPAVSLPEYVGPTDKREANPPGQAIDPGAAIDLTQLRRLDSMLGGSTGGGTGVGLGSGAPGTGSGNGKPGGGGKSATVADAEKPVMDMPAPKKPPMTKQSEPTTVAKLPPKLPDLPKELIEPMPKTGDVKKPDPIHLDEDFDYSLTKYVAPPRRTGGIFGIGGEELGPEPGYFEVKITPKRSLRKLKALGKDVVWVIDTSGSIRQNWVDAVRKGVANALDGLNPGDRFNIIMFKDTVNVFSPEGLIDFNANTAEAARRFLTAAESSGNTDVNRALGRLIVRNVPADRVYQIVLVSDGVPTAGSLDARQIINLITRENDLVGSIFCVGVGDKMNRELLEFLAYRNKGFVVYPDTWTQTAAQIRDLAGRLRFPVLKDATFDAVGVDTSTIYPRIPRDVYQGMPLKLYGRYTDMARQLSMRLTGVNGPDVLDLTFKLDFSTATVGDDALATDWAFWKLHHLYSEVIRQGQTEELQQQMDQLRRRYNLKLAY
ncbi:VWA domain-containing protein [Planctomycetales bacterium ZRK34]|nr:VWA domain-containing protein [Planctomycetales bacterium ZRK34]